MPQQVGKFDFTGIPPAGQAAPQAPAESFDFAGIGKPAAPAPPQMVPFKDGMRPAQPGEPEPASIIDLLIGAGKQFARQGVSLGRLINPSEIPESAESALGLDPANRGQSAGMTLGNVAELAVPVTKAVTAAKAIPTVAKAGQKFQNVMAAAKNVPVDVNGPGSVALRIQQLADRGASMPMVVRKFLARVTDPDKGVMTYEEARDFASNISRLSANEYGRLTPVVAREVAEMRVAINKAVADAAQKVGKGAEYKAAMREYAQAMKMREFFNEAWKNAKGAAPYLTAGGAAYWMTSKLRRALGGE